MTWDVCLEYANGNQTLLKTYRHRETALKLIDLIYSTYGYPMHVAYIVRPSQAKSALNLVVPA
ncbi:MAG: family 2 glycosyl transferase [Roseofilum sp. SBFL]|uniref:hypothetical protein n=1 Tax=unclassified Roseofilum TaxID=2620099 RepID=UPI001B1D1D5E|nr:MULTISPECIES: hypothetical protein [unclassified Roseofilum]MBP0012282.1 family 2 glycosyl transferase [Roseofilum sp. SID3]MBP0022908.1 family 2 glycosyl transferase [Roseofilum sp. SID2]MBP0037168.1 family 2 glycosyl transferase [Roseofilum sp. SID1]MBP0041634.1 family 2 glycosyl transferase [Roseofilum sp. SBFL]